MAASPNLSTAVEILQRFYADETEFIASPPDKRDFVATWGRTVSPEIKLHQSADLPYGGVYQGHKRFLEWGEEMSKYFSTLDMLNPRIFEAPGGDGSEIVVLSTVKFVTRETGKEWIAPLAQAIKVDREKGWVVEIRPFYWNVAGLNEALGMK